MKSRFRIRKFTLARLILLSLGLMNTFAAFSKSKDVTFLVNGVSCQLEQGVLKVEFVTSDIVRVQYTGENVFKGNSTGICMPHVTRSVRFTSGKEIDSCVLKSDSLIVKIDLNTGFISYLNTDGSLLLREDGKLPRVGEKKVMEHVVYDEQSKRIEKTADGDKEVKNILRRDTIGYTWKYRINFDWQPLEALYGFGSHMEDYMNLRGKELYLCQHNLKAMVPVLVSTNGYGLLFDAGCGMVFKDNSEGSYVELEAAKEIDYYFMKGRTLDGVVANYRLLTGASPMMPLHLFGYIQSKERYVSSDDLINTLKEYRQFIDNYHNDKTKTNNDSLIIKTEKEINKIEENVIAEKEYVYPDNLPVLEVLTSESVNKYKDMKKQNNISKDYEEYANELLSNKQIQEVKIVSGDHMIPITDPVNLAQTIKEFIMAH